MQTTVYLIRHGEVEYKRDLFGRRLIYAHNVHLSIEGERQMRRLSQKLKQDSGRFDLIYTSPYTRARESAAIIAEQYNFPSIKFKDGLKDVWAPGWVGTPIEELCAIGGDIYSQPSRSLDQESLEQLVKRITTTFNRILQESQGKTIGIVGHGDPIRVLIYRLQNPEGTLSKMSELVKSDYLNKGQAWRLLFDEKTRLIEKDLIIPDELMVKGEREF